MASRGFVLHVEDDVAVCKALALLLRAEGYDVVSAHGGRQALASVVDDHYQVDVLIVDFHLDAEMDGTEVAERVTKALGYSVPTIILTADPANAEAPWLTGAPVWLARKPMNPALLVAAMPPLVELSRSIRNLSRTSR